MSRLDYLHYTNNPPYRELLFILAREQALNSYEAYIKTLKFAPNVTQRQVESALVELELRGILIRVNDCFTIAEDWLRELVLFLNEFAELQDELESYTAMLQRKGAKRP
jgi:hypothetical protein